MTELSAPRTSGYEILVIALVLRTAEFLFYHLLLVGVDRVSRLPRGEAIPEAMRLYRENIALKAQLEALEVHVAKLEGKKRVRVQTRAAQVFAYLLTRGDESFQRYYLSASVRTIQRWATRFRSFRRYVHRGGRPPIDAKVIELIVTLKRENGSWGQRRIQEELRRMGIVVSQPTIQKILRDNGFSPRPGRKIDFERVRSAAKDAAWAIDFFAVKTSKGAWTQALVVIDIYTRELMDLRVHDGWDVDSAWTARMFAAILRRTGRSPIAVVHDHGTHFLGMFTRALQVLGIDEVLTPPQLPSMNCYAERAIWSVRHELLRHVPVADAEQLQFYLDEYRRYANADRSHQGLDGQTPEEVAKGATPAKVLDLEELRARHLVRRSYAHGLLHGYEFVDDDRRDAA